MTPADGSVLGWLALGMGSPWGDLEGGAGCSMPCLSPPFPPSQPAAAGSAERNSAMQACWPGT